ncbi:hypothetical protein MWN41_00200 [Ornithobacterium rhinotracheale]|uniref:hypothetical protein n=1 Tax=Ornithobacterium rhinotracheale TaxID=28251 RepID=UPI001FF63EB6|nr:hypothetical protein [Ornithobacterium rhinotracheale]MCK0201444.1 hypothetical protein [Ornithobacterium rhinotracheale]
MYSYEFEYFLGSKSIEAEDGNVKYEYTISILQITDTGFYEGKDRIKGNEIEKFKSADDSQSLFIFVFEVSSKKNKDGETVWSRKHCERLNLDDFKREKENTNIIIKAKRELITEEKESYLLKELDKSGYGFLAVKYNIEYFRDEKSTFEKIEDFIEKVEHIFNINIKKGNF